MKRADVKYQLSLFSGDLLETDGSAGAVRIVLHGRTTWNPNESLEQTTDPVYINLSPVDAVELAAMLIKSAEHAEALEAVSAAPRRKY